MKKNNIYKGFLDFEDEFDHRYACWAYNHRGWAKMKKSNKRLAKKSEPMKCVCKGTIEIELPNGDWVERPARVEFYNNKWGGE